MKQMSWSWLRLTLLVLGLVLFFSGERYFATDTFHNALRYGGLAMMVMALLLALLQIRQASKAQNQGEAVCLRYSVAWQSAVLLSPLCYLLYQYLLGDKGVPETFTQKFLLIAWLALGVIGLIAGVGVELGIKHFGKGSLTEPRRVVSAGLRWLKVGLVIGGFVGLNYAAAKKDKTWDWSYFKATKPGTSTVKMVKDLQEPLDVAVFFPYKNPIKPAVMQYFDYLAKENPKIQVKEYDKDLNPVQADEFRVTSNGQVVLRFKDRRERIDIGTKVTDARGQVAKLDTLFQKGFLSLTSNAKTAYFTRGHGEMDWFGGQDPLTTIRGVEMLLRSQNYQLKAFETDSGSMTEVPSDAAAIVIVGPTKPFLAEEIEVIRKFVDAGGKLMVFFDQNVDPDNTTIKSNKDPLTEYVASLGIKFERQKLANDKAFVRAQNTNADHWFIYSNVFGSHVAVESLSRHEEQVQVLMQEAGYLTTDPSHKDWQITELMKSTPSTFVDLNQNYNFDQGKEQRKSVPVAAAGERTIEAAADGKEAKIARVYVFADASVISDFLIRNPANQVLLVDAMRWMVGEAKFTGTINSEEDVKIRHSKGKNLFIFHGSIFLIPLLVLLAGLIATRKPKVRGANA